jgi:4-amino-4-deoxy-L-arabinose transferase-like glycosyltransferase
VSARSAILAIVIIASIAIARIAATHSVFAPTYDEPAHVAAGHQYIDEHRYTIDKSHPPLARIVFALVPRASDAYMDDFIAARRGNLLFVLLAIAGVAWWAWIAMGPTEALIAAALFSLLPPILAHGGVATTDMACTAAFACAMPAFQRWLDSPTWPRTAALAVITGLALVTKFSFPLFFAIGTVVLLIQWRTGALARPPSKEQARRLSSTGIVAAFGAMFIVTAVYFFHQLPRFFTGIAAVLAHNRAGHGAYFLGEVRTNGWWDYFPIVLAIKTPIPFLLLAIAGIRRNRTIAIIAALILAFAMTSHLNLGVRYLLPIYVPLALLAASLRWPAVILGAWLAVNSAFAHPDYLPWFNALGGAHPERIVLDSNFDWGQDVLRLRAECAKRGVHDIGVRLFTLADLRRLGMPHTHAIDPLHRDDGWCAISEGEIIPTPYPWLDARPFIRVGKTIRLFPPLASRTSPYRQP